MIPLRHVPAAAFLVIASSYIVVALQAKPRVLVVQSYWTDYAWTKQSDQGLHSVLDDKPYAVRWHYMDTKRHPDDRFKRVAANRALLIARRWDADVIIAVDDNAQLPMMSLVRTDGPAGLGHGVSLVYAGVNGRPEDYGFDKAVNVTGILERRPLGLVKEALLQTYCPPGSAGVCELQVRYIADASTTAQHNRRNVCAPAETPLDPLDPTPCTHPAWGPEVRLDMVQVGTFADWKRAVEDAGDVDVLLFTDYRTIAHGDGDLSPVPPEQLLAWARNNGSPPTFGLGSSYDEVGEPFSVAASGFEQGEVAARLAVEIVDGASPADIPQRSAEGITVYVREGTGWDVEVPAVFGAFARSTGTYFRDGDD